MKGRIPSRAYESLLRWADKTEPGDKTFQSSRKAISYIKKLSKQSLVERPMFATAKLNQRLLERDRRACDGSDKSWVHATQLGWLRHYRARRRSATGSRAVPIQKVLPGRC